MTEEQVRAIFLLAGIEVQSVFKTENGCSPGSDRPWWLVKTRAGLIHIGWRKRVISIDWSDTPIRQVLTSDDVTKSANMIHAYGYASAVGYLGVWRALENQLEAKP